MAKDELLKVRVSQEMKEAVKALAEKRGESESLIIREALIAYIESREITQAPPKPKKQKVA